jgi:hypothetical protein
MLKDACVIVFLTVELGSCDREWVIGLRMGEW